MALSEGLIDYVGRHDTDLARNQTKLLDLVRSAAAWLETQIDWHLGSSLSRDLYFPGGCYSILLPQPGTVATVSLRSGSSWAVESASDWAQEGEDGRDLVRTSGDPWPGISLLSFIRTPGMGDSSGFGSGVGGARGSNTVRVALTAGFDDVSNWPGDLLSLLVKIVVAEYRRDAYIRPRSPGGDDTGSTYYSHFTPQDWKTLKKYKEGRPVLRAA